jgi:hypothetical protein
MFEWLKKESMFVSPVVRSLEQSLAASGGFAQQLLLALVSH